MENQNFVTKFESGTDEGSICFAFFLRCSPNECAKNRYYFYLCKTWRKQADAIGFLDTENAICFWKAQANTERKEIGQIWFARIWHGFTVSMLKRTP